MKLTIIAETHSNGVHVSVRGAYGSKDVVDDVTTFTGAKIRDKFPILVEMVKRSVERWGKKNEVGK